MSDCVVEVADLPRAVPGDTEDSAWANKAKRLLRQSFGRFGPVLEVHFPTAVASVRFASPRGPGGVMSAAPRGFLRLGEGEVRVRLPGSSEAAWRRFPAPREPDPGEPAAPDVQTKKRKPRPHERFAPPPGSAAAGGGEPPDESERFWEEQREKRQQRPSGSAPDFQAGASGGGGALPDKHVSASGQAEPPAAALLQEPPRPTPAAAAAGAAKEDLAVCKGEEKVALEMASLLERPFSQQRKELRAIRRRWHPDKQPDNREVATRVFQFIQSHESWLAFHGLT